MTYAEATVLEPPEGGGIMCILDEKGDVPVTWVRSKPDEVAIAHASYNEARSRGFSAHRINPDGSTGEVLHAFDPKAQRMILVPPQAGG